MTHKNERGATAILVAGSLMLLIGMAAVAVDLSAGWNERRQDQTAADLGATAAAVYSVSEAIGIQAALDTIQANLDTTYTPAEWQTLWTGCTDPDRPAGFVPVDNPWSGVSTDKLDCMSIDISNQSGNPEFRVRVPNQIVDAQFGRVIGTGSIETSASAHSTYLMTGGGDILPFGITNAAPYGTNCVLQPAAGLAAPPCDGGSLGNFGFMLVPNWGNDDKGTTADCTSLSNLISEHVAVGIDHLVLWAGGPDGTPGSFPGTGGSSPSSLSATQELYAKKDDCSLATGTAVANDDTPTWPINTLQTATGVGSSFDIKDGLIGAAVDPAITFLGLPPRLQQTVNAHTVTIQEKISGPNWADYIVDNTPLWRYLVAPSEISETSITGPCNRNSIEAVDAPKTAYGDTSPNGWELARDRMANCLSAYQTYLDGNPSNPEAIFDKSIMENPRFAWSPRFHFTDFGSGSSWQPIHSFEATYIDGVWFNCNGSATAPINSSSSCAGNTPKGLQFYPGEYADGLVMKAGASGNLRLDQVTAYVIPIEAMPDEVKDTYPGDLDGPFRVQLVR